MRGEMKTTMLAVGLVCGLGTGLGSSAYGAEAGDGVVDTGRVSHVLGADLRPRVPEQGEAFEVRFKAAAGDLTFARVGVDDGGGRVWYDASVVGVDGPDDVWGVTVPGVSSSRFDYVVEVRDVGAVAYYTPSGVSAGALPSGEGFVVDFTTMEHVPLGVTKTDAGFYFRVWAPGAANAWLGGDFNGYTFDTPMTRVGNYFNAFLAGDPNGSGYMYSFDGFSWKPDPYAVKLNPSQGYESVLHDPDRFVWTTDDFVAPPPEEWVVYQLHVGTFAGRNDPFGPALTPSRFFDVAFRVDHLVELGVNAVYLNPINEFPFNFSGGYNQVSMFAFESAYGTPDQFKFLVDELHSRGIAVIIDTVWNHMSSTDNFKWFFDGTQIYYDTPNEVGTPWGPQLDFDRPEVFQLLVDSARRQLEEFRLDGFRADAVFEIYGANQVGSGRALLRAINDLQDREHSDAFVIAEDYSDQTFVTGSTSQFFTNFGYNDLGLGFDSQYSNNFKEAIRAAVFSVGGADINRLAGAMDGLGQITGTRAFHYFELHDDAWPLNGRERAVRTIDSTFPHDNDFARDKTILGNAMTLLSRGVPAILQGTEWLEDGGWIEDPPGTINKIDWSHKTTYRGVFDFYSDLISLRTSEPGLFANSGMQFIQVNDGADVMIFERVGSDDSSFVVIANFSDTDFGEYRFGLPRATEYEVVINSEWTRYGGSGLGPSGIVAADGGPQDGEGQSIGLALPPRSVIVLRAVTDVELPCPTDLSGDGATGPDDLFRVLASFGVDGGGDVDGDGATGPGDLFEILAAFGSSCP